MFAVLFALSYHSCFVLLVVVAKKQSRATPAKQTRGPRLMIARVLALAVVVPSKHWRRQRVYNANARGAKMGILSPYHNRGNKCHGTLLRLNHTTNASYNHFIDFFEVSVSSRLWRGASSRVYRTADCFPASPRHPPLKISGPAKNPS